MTDIKLVQVDPAQAAAARINGHPVYSATVELAPSNWGVPVHKPPTPTPVGTYPSGITPPPVGAGLRRALFDDFLGTAIDTTTNFSTYDGVPGGTNGRWLSSHVTVADSVVSLNAYQDAAGNDAGALNWVGGGFQTQTRFPVGSVFSVAMRDDALTGFTAILLLMGNNWPPEIDFEEGGQIFIHWGKGNTQQGFSIPSKYMDTNWHLWQCIYGTQMIQVICDGIVITWFTNPSVNAPTDPNGLEQNVFLAAQYQSGDGGTLVNDPTITAANPRRQQLDWVAIDVPA